MMKYTIEQICEYCDKLTYDKYEREDNETNYALLELIAYFSGKHGLCIEPDTWTVKRGEHGKYYDIIMNLGPNKEFAKKTPVLLDIFNRYCEILPECVNTSYHGSAEYEPTGRYYIKGRIPNVLGKIILKQYKKNEQEDNNYIDALVEKAKDEKSLRNKLTKSLYDKLMD